MPAVDTMAAMPRLTRIRAVPWLLVFEAVRTVHAHVNDSLSPRERRRAMEIVRSSHGLPQHVTPAQREELRAIARKLDLGHLARDLVPHMMRARGRRRRW
jgi:tellurite resistance protein